MGTPAPTANVATPEPEPAAIFQAISGEVAKIFAKCKDAVVRIQAVDSLWDARGHRIFHRPGGDDLHKLFGGGPFVEPDGRVRR